MTYKLSDYMIESRGYAPAANAPFYTLDSFIISIRSIYFRHNIDLRPSEIKLRQRQDYRAQLWCLRLLLSHGY